MRAQEEGVAAGEGAEDDEGEAARVDGVAGGDGRGEGGDEGFRAFVRVRGAGGREEVLARGEDGVVGDEGVFAGDARGDHRRGLAGKVIDQARGAFDEDGVEVEDGGGGVSGAQGAMFDERIGIAGGEILDQSAEETGVCDGGGVIGAVGGGIAVDEGQDGVAGGFGHVGAGFADDFVKGAEHGVADAGVGGFGAGDEFYLREKGSGLRRKGFVHGRGRTDLRLMDLSAVLG